MAALTQPTNAAMGMDEDGKSKLPVSAMAFNAVLAGAFFFILQRFGLQASVETALMWAGAGAVAAAVVAWKQSV